MERTKAQHEKSAAKAAHTPGPWRVGDAGFTVFGPKREAPSPVRIATMPGIGTPIPTDAVRANARLIAAAPDLLAACEDAAESLARLPDVDGAWRATCLAQLRAAIARARGEAEGGAR